MSTSITLVGTSGIEPPVPKSAIPPLPKHPDTTGKHWINFSDPSPRSPTTTIGAFAAGVGTGAVVIGRQSKSSTKLAVGAAGFAGAALIGATVAVQKFLGAPHNAPLTTDEQVFLQACPNKMLREPYRRAAVIGRLLTGVAPDTFETYYRALTPEQIQTIQTHRAQEAEFSWRWAQDRKEKALRIIAEDGIGLVGHAIFLGRPSQKWVIIAHGYHGAWNETSHHARHWAQMGYNVLLPEMRGHGHSGGALVGMGWLDRRDLITWTQWLVAMYGLKLHIVLHGHSMGGASVLLAGAERDLPPQVKCVVSDCAYSDALNAFAAVLRGGFHVPARPTIDLARKVLRARKGGYDLADASPEKAAPQIRVPALILHGENDNFVPPYMAWRIYQALPQETGRLVMIPGAGHCQAFFADPQRYWDEIETFVARATA